MRKVNKNVFKEIVQKVQSDNKDYFCQSLCYLKTVNTISWYEKVTL